ncbi:hypothetical protein U3516DRAFT_804620 [Neocallimastix sp. 'constans']
MNSVKEERSENDEINKKKKELNDEKYKEKLKNVQDEKILNNTSNNKIQDESTEEDMNDLKEAYNDLQDQVQKMKINMENKTNDSILQNYITSLQNDIDNKINSNIDINSGLPLPSDWNSNKSQITYNNNNNKTEISKESYFKLRRDYELLKILYEKKQSEHEAILSESRQAFEGQLNILESKIIYLQNNLASLTDNETLRALKRENADLSLRLDNMTNELESMREISETQQIENEQRERVLQRQITDILTQSKTIESEKMSLKNKIKALEQENKSLRDRNEELSKENNEIQKEISLKKTKLEETIHQFNIEISNLRLSTIKQKNQCDNEKKELNDKLLLQANQLKNSQQKIQELMVNQSIIEKKNIDKLQKMKHDEMEKHEKIQDEKNELENSISKLKKKIIEMENNNKNISCEYNIEISKIKSELLITKNENGKLIKDKQSFEEKIQENDIKISNLEKRIKEITEIKNSLEEENQKLRKNEEEISTQNENWEIKINNMRNENNLSKETYEEYISKQSLLIEKLKNEEKNKAFFEYMKKNALINNEE